MNLFLILYQAIFVASATVETLHPYIPPSFDHAHTGVRVDVRVPLPYDTSYPHPLDGDMVAELRSWGYKDIGDELSELCHFQQHGINQALAALGIDSRSLKEGGPNKCFHITHEDGPTVLPGHNGHSPTNPASQQYIGPDGVQYRVTGAWASIGINPISGVVYFINRKSPFQAARVLWRRQDNPPLSGELPLLRSSSDIAWGFWNRATRRMVNLQNIKYLMSLDVVNDETLAIIERALKYRKESEHPEQDPDDDDPDVQPWPGTTFVLNGDSEGMALLGSPNAISAGYFLAQHKAQLGGNKVISKITVFNEEVGDLPHLLFWVADKPEEEEPEDPMDTHPHANVESRVLYRSKNGKEILREHICRANL